MPVYRFFYLFILLLYFYFLVFLYEPMYTLCFYVVKNFILPDLPVQQALVSHRQQAVSFRGYAG